MLHVRTSSGSLYVLDLYNTPMTWERREAGEGSVLVRTKGGELYTFPSIRVGKRMYMYGPSLTPGGLFREISTTPVVSIEWVPICDCGSGKETFVACDPFDSEIHNKFILGNWCDDCYRNRAWDV